MATQAKKYLTGDAAFAVDQKGIIVLWNPAAEREFGIAAEDALGKRCWTLLRGKDLFGNRYCCRNCPLRDMVSDHESVHGFQVLFRTATEGPKKFAVNCLSIFDRPDGGLLYHICHGAEDDDERPPAGHLVKNHLQNVHKNSLTDREIQVLALLAEGKSTHEIASSLTISEATVRNHIQHMLYKLHVHNRLEAVVMGQRIDLI